MSDGRRRIEIQIYIRGEEADTGRRGTRWVGHKRMRCLIKTTAAEPSDTIIGAHRHIIQRDRVVALEFQFIPIDSDICVDSRRYTALSSSRWPVSQPGYALEPSCILGNRYRLGFKCVDRENPRIIWTTLVSPGRILGRYAPMQAMEHAPRAHGISSPQHGALDGTQL